MTRFIGHRGSLGYGVENTIEAFLARKDDNLYGLECDIRISTNGSFFIMHDDNLKRLANICDKNIWEYSDEEINNITLFQDFNNHHFTGKIAYLEDYLKICSKFNLYAIIEIKYSPNLSNDDISASNALFSLIDKYNLQNNVIIISFMEECLKKLRNKYPNIPMQLLVCGNIDKYLNTCIKYNFDIDSCLDNSINKENVDKYHQNNLKVNIWTIDDIETANSLKKLNVDFITSNILH